MHDYDLWPSKTLAVAMVSLESGCVPLVAPLTDPPPVVTRLSHNFRSRFQSLGAARPRSVVAPKLSYWWQAALSVPRLRLCRQNPQLHRAPARPLGPKRPLVRPKSGDANSPNHPRSCGAHISYWHGGIYDAENNARAPGFGHPHGECGPVPSFYVLHFTFSRVLSWHFLRRHKLLDALLRR